MKPAGHLLGFAGLLAAFELAGAGAAAQPAMELVGLTADNMLVLFRSDRPAEVRRVKLTGVRGALLGLDYRPADGRLYGLSSTNDLYTLEPSTGAASAIATLTVPFDGGFRSGVDFNPQTDRLRLIGGNGRNLRAHVELGAAAQDAPLTFGRRDRNAGKKPRITASAYTNSVARAPTTRLFNLDADLDVLVLQDPPNDGILATIGPLGIDLGPLAGFDILTEGGRDHAFVASGSILYSIDLATGAATRLGTIGDGKIDLIGLAIRLRR